MQRDIDVLMIYQDKKQVDESIKQVQELGLKLQTLVFGQSQINEIIKLQPKVILLSSNNIVSTTKFYIELLENHLEKISDHKVILLINNKESHRAYLACESGLFDNYVVINPLNEPQRLNLVLLQTLELIEQSHDKEGLQALINSGEEELAECILHGKNLKNSLNEKLAACEQTLVEASKTNIINDNSHQVMQRIVEVTFKELNQNLATEIQAVLDRMVDAKTIQSSISSRLDKHLGTNLKSSQFNELDLSALTASIELNKQRKTKKKLLIAEHSDLFVQVITEIFDGSDFIYDVAQDGIETLLKIKEFQPDVILMAYDLPNINGIEVTRRTRLDNNKVPIIAFSHQQDKGLISKWVPLGLSGYLIKPSTKNNILEEVNKAIESPVNLLKVNSHGQTKLEWVAEYSIGNKMIDEQHKVLFSVINEFFAETSKESVQTVFLQLSEYIKEHFRAEEALLKEIGYPRLSGHIKKHRALVNKFQEIQQRLSAYKIDEHHKIALFLYNWLAKHILAEDMDYKSFALKNNTLSFIENKPQEYVQQLS